MEKIEILSRTEKSGQSRLAVAVTDEAGNACSKGTFIFTESSFADTTVKTMLACGIGTPVENRRGGKVRRMFHYMHDTAADEGTAVALLHPFSFSYYNQFGYEKVSSHMILRFETRMLDFVPRRCSFVPYEPSMLPDLLQIYRAFAKGRNLLLPRTDEEHYKGKHVYICYDEGCPIAYIMFSESKTMYINGYRDTLLTVEEMAYISPKGLRETLSFLRMFEGEFDEIELRDCSIYSEIEFFLRHYERTRYTCLPDISAKVLNTEAMLRANTYPAREGSFTVKIIDELPTVSGVYNVCYGGGDCRVKRLHDCASADIAMPGQIFTRLVYGSDPLDEQSVRYFDGVEVYTAAEDLFRAFPKRSCGTFEHF